MIPKADEAGVFGSKIHAAFCFNWKPAFPLLLSCFLESTPHIPKEGNSGTEQTHLCRGSSSPTLTRPQLFPSRFPHLFCLPIHYFLSHQATLPNLSYHTPPSLFVQRTDFPPSVLPTQTLHPLGTTRGGVSGQPQQRQTHVRGRCARTTSPARRT